MALQIRITDPDSSNPVILDAATNKSVSFALNSADEGGKFTIAKNNSKADVINPDNGGYTKLWEVWDTASNVRLNYGPIKSITEQGTNWVVEGKGRSAFLEDFIDTRKTFYAPLGDFIDSLRFENISIEPKTTTLVYDPVVTSGQTTVFGPVTVNEKYYGLSKNTKDNIIDNQLNFRVGEIEPPNTFYSVDSFWAGMSTNDSIIVDLGDVFSIDRVDIWFPWWGGLARNHSRGYDFTLSYANDTESTLTEWKGRKFGPFHSLFTQDADIDGPRIDAPWRFNLGVTNSGTRYGVIQENVALDHADAVDLRYLRVNIADVRAWRGSSWGNVASTVDDWNYQCSSTENGGISEGIEINDRDLKPNNDCYASLLELSAYKKILPRDSIKPLALQRIDNNSMQIEYYHVPAASETSTTSAGYRLFEPGGLFRKFTVTFAGATSTYTTFFSSDCANCYPDGFNFGISDQNNTLIYASDNTSGTNISIKGPNQTKSVTMKGSSTAVITSVDAWKSVTDPLSWGSSYSYTDIANDYAILHFRGESLRWYATIPSDKTGATVKIEIRNKDNTGTWTSWSTLENSYSLPNNVSAESVYEITYGSNILASDTVYEVKITNLDGGYCSIDSFEGYWSGSMVNYNDDSSRIFHFKPNDMTQIYDSRFENGTAVKWNGANFVGFRFEGDRVILLSAKGRNHGIASVYLNDASQALYYGRSASGGDTTIPIPGGNADGGISINLDTGSRGAEIPQYILFDSNDYFPTGLPWGRYGISLVLREEDLQSYSANIYDTNNFVARCQDCKTPKGTQTINKYIYFDNAYIHETVGLSVSFDTKTHLEMVKSVAEAIQAEWEVNENGLRFEPRLGRDTNEVLREGHNVVVDYNIVNDASKVASMLHTSGADIDGLPLTTITEDRVNRATLGRTVMRVQDFRETANYLQLIGLSRMELRKRRYPEKRITVSYISDQFDLQQGDSFILYTKKQGPLRVRIMHMEISESGGRKYSLECERWPALAS